MDLDRWNEVISHKNKAEEQSDLKLMNGLLISQPAFRTLLQWRMRKPPRNVESILQYCVCRLLWHPLDSLYFGTWNIGGGLFIQHGYATSIDAESIGEKCWINQQVTIGYSGDQHPVIKDGCTIHAGAIVIGGVTMHSNSTAAAGAVVVKDVPENAIVAGVPAKIIKYKEL